MTQPDTTDLLLVEDDPQDAQYIQRLLAEFGSVDDRLLTFGEIHRADRLSAALGELDREPDVVLLDLNLPDSDGLATLDAAVEHAPHVPVVVVTGQQDRELGPEAIRRGAEDYLQKGRITGEILHRTVRYAIDRRENQREIRELNRQLSAFHRVVRDEVRSDGQVVVGRATELRRHVDPAAEPAVESLLDAAEHILDLTESAGKLLSVLSSDEDVAVEPLDVREVVAEQVEHARERYDTAITLDDGGVTHEPSVEGTPLLGAAVEQLLSNAVRHNDSDRPQVAVGLDTTEEHVTVEVADDGVGIPAVQRGLLNDPETRYHEQSGLGTGLYLAATVVEQLDGTLQFRSNQPRGTVVTITFDRTT